MSHSPYIIDGYHGLNIATPDGYNGNYSVAGNLTINSPGQLIASQGTLAAPGFILNNTSNSGIYWDSTHSSMALANAGTQVCYFTGGASIQFLGSLGVSTNLAVTGYIAGASNFFVQSYTKGITIRQNSLTANTTGVVLQQGYAVTNLTSNYTLVISGSTNNASASDTNGVFTNTGATGSITVTLPSAGTAQIVGFVHIFMVTVAQIVTITAGASDKINGGSTGGHATTSTVVVGMSIELVCTAINNWTTRIITNGNPSSPGVWAFT